MTAMQLFEVIRWGNDSDDPVIGGPNGPDTCFLVRADSIEQAGTARNRTSRGRSARPDCPAPFARWRDPD